MGPSKGTALCSSVWLHIFGNLECFIFRSYVNDNTIVRRTMVHAYFLNIVLLSIYRISSFSISGAQAAAISYVGEFHSIKTRSRNVTLATCFMPGSTMYQGLMGVLIMQSKWRFNVLGLMIGPWRVYLASCSFISAIAFIAITFLPESPKFLLAIGKHDEALATLRRVYRINTGQPEEV